MAQWRSSAIAGLRRCRAIQKALVQCVAHHQAACTPSAIEFGALHQGRRTYKITSAHHHPWLSAWKDDSVPPPAIGDRAMAFASGAPSKCLSCVRFFIGSDDARMARPTDARAPRPRRPAARG